LKATGVKVVLLHCVLIQTMDHL